MDILTMDTTPPCEHLDGVTDDALIYRAPPKREGDDTFACPCCGAIAYAKPHETLMPCPTCGVEAVKDRTMDDPVATIAQLSEVYEPEGVLIWLFAPHHLLGGEKPAQAILDGHADKVAGLVDQLVSGAFV